MWGGALFADPGSAAPFGVSHHMAHINSAIEHFCGAPSLEAPSMCLFCLIVDSPLSIAYLYEQILVILIAVHIFILYVYEKSMCHYN